MVGAAKMREGINLGKNFLPRQLISENARHPQIAAIGSRSIIVWDETTPDTGHIHSTSYPNHTATSNGAIVGFIQKYVDDEKSILNVIDICDVQLPVLNIINEKEVLVAYTKIDQSVFRKTSL